jgi:hypothetical protein
MDEQCYALRIFPESATGIIFLPKFSMTGLSRPFTRPRWFTLGRANAAVPILVGKRCGATFASGRMGPQAEPEDIRESREGHAATMEAANDLLEDGASLDSLTPGELCAAIHRLVERLEEFETNSIHAYLLRFRISIAASLINADYQRNRRSDDI